MMMPTKRKPCIAAKKTPAHTPVVSDADEEPAPGSPRTPSPPPDDERAATTTAAQEPATKKKKAPIILTEEQEVEMGEWMRLWEDKAKELHMESGVLLRTWYDSIRTKVGKLSTKKSGSASRDMTERDTFIMSNFGFLSTHISRMRGRTACSLGPQLTSDIASRRSRCSGSEIEISQPNPPPPPSPRTSSKGKTTIIGGRANVPKGISKRSSSRIDEETEVGSIIASLKKEQQKSTQMHTQISGLLSHEQSSSTAAWGSWMGAMPNDIDQCLLPRFYRESMNLVLGLIEESRHLPPISTYRRQQQQVPDQVMMPSADYDPQQPTQMTTFVMQPLSQVQQIQQWQPITGDQWDVEHQEAHFRPGDHQTSQCAF